MSEQIKVGDLVMVVRPVTCCQHNRDYVHYGYIYTVKSILGGITSRACGAQRGPRAAGDGFSYDVDRLKRIDAAADAISEDARKPLEETI
ncbi:MAG: hypothetical protein ACYDB1_00630 [Acidiferrobacteraceae bacterium]